MGIAINIIDYKTTNLWSNNIIIILTPLGLIADEKSNPSAINGNQMEGQEAQLNFDETLAKGKSLINILQANNR